MDKPPIITLAVSKRRNRTVVYILAALAVLVAVIVFLLYLALPTPPKESELLRNFYKNRAAFEQLRDMLKADSNLRRVAEWGIETGKPFFIGKASAANLPVDRYEQYLALLHQVGGVVAFRNDGEPADPGVLVWGWGWGSHTRHIEISWVDEAPANQVTNLDLCRAPHIYGNQEYFFRHIDDKWYLDTDMRPF